MSDDFSLFLHQVLLNSSSSPSITGPTSAQLGSGSGHRNLDPTAADGYFPANLSSSLMGNVDNDVDEQECESEDGGFEVLAEEAPAKTAPSRNSSKRCRAAEVHNLSEKRRRSKINEKMKALQNLIPNSNKTDKASMLDEAIEYLKQLQLQVQMLTMRNGLSLYPMCLPGVSDPSQLTQINLGLLEGNRPMNMGLMGVPNVAQETSDSARLPGPEISTVIHSDTSLGFSSMVADIFREDVLPHRGQDADRCQTNLLGLEMVEKASSTPISCETRPSRGEDNTFEAHVLESRRPDSELLTNLQSDKEIAPRFHR